MAAYEDWKNAEALVEVRGCLHFSNQDNKNPSASFNTFAPFIQEEADWFFNN